MGLTYSIEKELTTVIAEGSFSVGHVHATFSKSGPSSTARRPYRS